MTRLRAARHRCAGIAAAALVAVMPSGAATGAEVLVDPMQPPADFRAAEREPADPAQPQLVLQSTRISSAGRSAVISGITVQAGDRLAGATVSRIAAGEVVLLQEGVEQVLKLYPAVDKRAAQAGRETQRPQPPARGGAR